LYLTDITDVSVIAPVRLKYFPKDGPASALVQVSALAYPEAKIEMDAIAAIDT
jgi:2-iminobutanoate/2-iminopropanoate deaminase